MFSIAKKEKGDEWLAPQARQGWATGMQLRVDAMLRHFAQSVIKRKPWVPAQFLRVAPEAPEAPDGTGGDGGGGGNDGDQPGGGGGGGRGKRAAKVKAARGKARGKDKKAEDEKEVEIDDVDNHDHVEGGSCGQSQGRSRSQ